VLHGHRTVTVKAPHGTLLIYSVKHHRTVGLETRKAGTTGTGAVGGHANQPPSFEFDHRETWDLRRRTEIIPVKDSHTRIKPLALASGHGRYITVTTERTIVSVGEWPLHIAVINL
jgi:hypothetical protein